VSKSEVVLLPERDISIVSKSKVVLLSERDI